MTNKKTQSRKSIRLKDYDYSQAGMYFVTVCAEKKRLYFDKYPVLYNIVKNEIENLPARYKHISVDSYIVMPNHIHMIIHIEIPENSVGATLAVARDSGQSDKRAGARPAPTLGDIVGSLKSLCVNKWMKYIKINKIRAEGKFWQRNYYEHIIRNENELKSLYEYIENNPNRWEFDRENPDGKPDKDECKFWNRSI